MTKKTTKTTQKEKANTKEKVENNSTTEEKNEHQETTEKTDDAVKDASKEESKEIKEEIRIIEENVDFKDRYLRLSADFDNYRKRTLKEKADLIKSAGESIFKELLPLIDDLERAVKAFEAKETEEANVEGIKLVYNKFKDFLKSNGIKLIEALHQDFDPEIHEAVTKFPAEDEKMKGKVIDVIENGYYLNDKIIRYAKVVVGE